MWLAAALALSLLAQSPDFSAEGLKALEARDYEQAAQWFSKAAAADPKDYSAHFHLALAQSLMGRDAEAIAGYRKVLELKPGLYEAELNLGVVLLRQKQVKDALPLLKAAADQKPDQARPRLFLAQAQYESGDFTAAEGSYGRALALDPKSAPAELGLAQAMAAQDRFREAEPHFRKAAELDPSYKDGLLQLAAFYEKRGQKAEAIAVYEQFPDNVAARERLGDLLIGVNRPAEAIPHLEYVVAKSPTTAARVALALAYGKNKEFDKEIATLEKAVETEPANYDLRMFCGRALRDRKNYAEAARQFLAAAKLKQDSVDAWDNLAGMLHAVGDYPQALGALDRVRALGGETEIDVYLRALIFDAARDPKGALASYERFLAMSKDKHPDEEFKARHRAIALQKELNKR